jgi:hypothetical protein
MPETTIRNVSPQPCREMGRTSDAPRHDRELEASTRGRGAREHSPATRTAPLAKPGAGSPGAPVFFVTPREIFFVLAKDVHRQGLQFGISAQLVHGQ